MGAITTGAEVKCFNGPKSWRTQWFTSNALRPQKLEGHIDIETLPGLIWRGQLVGTYDYWESGTYDPDVGHRVIAKLGDLFLHFNRDEGYTKDVGGFTYSGSNPPNSKSYYVDRVQVTRQAEVVNQQQSQIPVGGTLGDGTSTSFLYAVSHIFPSFDKQLTLALANSYFR